MASLEQVSVLIQQLGPVLDPLLIDFHTDQRCWEVVLDDEVSLLIDFDAVQNKLVVTGEVGQPEVERQLELYEQLLTYNSLWQVTGGGRMALDTAGGNVVMLFDVTADGLEIPALADILSSLAGALRAWREIVTRPPGAASLGSTEIGFPSMVRV